MEIEAHGEITKVDDERRQVFGWAYVTHDVNGQVVIDKSGEFIEDYDELEKAAYRFVLNSRKGGDMHLRKDSSEPVVKSTMIESFVMTPDKARAMGIPEGTVPTGWWTGWQIEDEDLWQAVKRGERPAFSVHGSGVRKRVS